MSEQSSAEHQGNQPSAAKRRKARTLALQALYQWQLAKSSVSQIEAEFAVDNDMTKVDVPYFREILRGVTMNKSELEAQFAPFLDRPVDDVDPVELSLLRMGAYELMKRVDVPYRVVINEGVELAKSLAVRMAINLSMVFWIKWHYGYAPLKLVISIASLTANKI